MVKSDKPEVIEQDVFGGKEKATDMCVVALMGKDIGRDGGLIGIVKRGETGYYPTDWKFPTYEAAQEYAKEFNQAFGVSEEEAIKIILSSMRAVEGADE